MTSLRQVDVKRDLASVLVSQGIAPVQAEMLANEMARRLHHKHQGTKTYWPKGRDPLGLTLRKRMDIFEDWDIHGRKGKSGDGLLNDHGISDATLDRIIREGRKKHWPRYGAKKGSHETRCRE